MWQFGVQLYLLLLSIRANETLSLCRQQGGTKVYRLFLEDCITYFHILKAIFLG